MGIAVRIDKVEQDKFKKRNLSTWGTELYLSIILANSS